MTKESLVEKIEAILEIQIKDAEKRFSNSSYYGDTGKWVSMAISMAESAIKGSIDKAIEAKSTNPITLAAGRSKAQFREEGDPDGYGLATYNEIIRDLFALQKQMGEVPTLDPDEVMSLPLNG